MITRNEEKVTMSLREIYAVLILIFICIVPVYGVEGGSGLPPKNSSLKEAFKDKFYIGASLNVRQIYERDTAANRVLDYHFNSIVAENSMKSALLQPREGEFYFKDADRFVELGERKQMQLIGHTLIWHSQAPRWFFVDEDGNDVSRSVLIERMKTHITTVVGRYKGRIHGWDVLNEAIMDDGSYRKSKFYEIIGEEYIELAFKFAQEADPDAELYYNDYSMANANKRNTTIAMVKNLQKKGIKVSGIGMQGHVSLQHPGIDDFERSIVAFSELGVDVMITEMDITVLPFPQRTGSAEVSLSYEYRREMNPYPDGLPAQIEKELEERYVSFFALFLKHHEKITRVTLWGISDGNSWRNNWPMPGRTDFPLLFDRKYREKPVVQRINQLATSAEKNTGDFTVNTLTDKEIKGGWELLFNGRDLQGWTSVGRNNGPERGWTVDNGVLTVNKGGAKRGGDIITKGEYGQFELYFEFRLTKGANGGVKYLFANYNEGGWLGSEYQVLDDDFHPDANAGRDGNRKTASLYDVIPAGKKSMKPTGEWNKGRIIVKGSKVTHYLNGQKTIRYDRSGKAYKNAVMMSKFAKAEPLFGSVEKGYILLQDHQDEVSFRNIKILNLSK